MNLTLTILGIDDSMLIIHTKNTLNTQEYIPYIMNSNNSQSVQAEECDVSKMSAKIKELEMEYDIGNLDKKDFINRRSELKTEVSEIITELKKK